MQAATHLAAAAVAMESAWRVRRCNPFSDGRGWSQPCVYFAISYALCIVAVFFNLKSKAFFQSKLFRDRLSFLHALDGVSALLMGVAVYLGSDALLVLTLLTITKFFLLHMLSRMVTGEASATHWEVCVQCTKTYIHHVGSFLFVHDAPTALWTATWRFISMNGHAALTYRKSLVPELYIQIMWAITHARNAVLIAVLVGCSVDPRLRRGFALSASGHMAYMLVRVGPVFRLGSLYMEGGAGAEDKKKWWAEQLTDGQRLRQLLSGKYNWFLLEVSLLLLGIVVMLALRVTTYAEVDEATCTFY